MFTIIHTINANHNLKVTSYFIDKTLVYTIDVKNNGDICNIVQDSITKWLGIHYLIYWYSTKTNRNLGLGDVFH